MIENIVVKGERDKYFEDVWQTYLYSFPQHELRQRDNFISAIQRGANIEAFIKDGMFIGFIIFWKFDGFIYIEYLALCKEVRSLGYGGKALKCFLDSYSDKFKIILDIDPINDEISHRREGFYLRLGFKVCSQKHIHPPINNPNDNCFELILLSYPTEVTDKEYSELKDAIYNKIVTYSDSKGVLTTT